MPATLTTHYGLSKYADGDLNWGTGDRSNWDSVDNLLFNCVQLSVGQQSGSINVSSSGTFGGALTVGGAGSFTGAISVLGTNSSVKNLTTDAITAAQLVTCNNGLTVAFNTPTSLTGPVSIGGNVHSQNFTSAAAGWQIDYLGNAEFNGNVIMGGSGYMRTASFTSGLRGWNISADGSAEFNNVNVRGELRASVFKVNEIAATAGTFGVFYSASTLYAPMVTPASVGTSFTFQAKNSDVTATAMMFGVGDIVRTKAYVNSGGLIIADIWLTITARTNVGVYTTYTATLSAGSINATVPAGTAMVDYGPANTGFITMSADGTIGSSPNLTMATHSGTPWSGFTPLIREGNLNGSWGYSSNLYGWAAGQYGVSGQSWITIETTNGIRIGNALVTKAKWDTAGKATFGDFQGSGGSEVPANSSSRVEIGSAVVQLITRDGGAVDTARFRLDTAGVLTLGPMSTAGVPVNSTSRMELSGGGLTMYTRSGAGVDRFVGGWNSAGVVYIGEITAGKSFVQVDSTNGVTMNVGNVGTFAQLFPSGDFVAGQAGTGQSNLYYNASAGTLNLRNGVTNLIVLDAAGSITVGQVAANQSNVLISSGGIAIRNNTTAVTTINAAPDVNGFYAIFQRPYNMTTTGGLGAFSAFGAACTFSNPGAAAGTYGGRAFTDVSQNFQIDWWKNSYQTIKQTYEGIFFDPSNALGSNPNGRGVNWLSAGTSATYYGSIWANSSYQLTIEANPSYANTPASPSSAGNILIRAWGNVTADIAIGAGSGTSTIDLSAASRVATSAGLTVGAIANPTAGYLLDVRGNARYTGYVSMNGNHIYLTDTYNALSAGNYVFVGIPDSIGNFSHMTGMRCYRGTGENYTTIVASVDGVTVGTPAKFAMGESRFDVPWILHSGSGYYIQMTAAGDITFNTPSTSTTHITYVGAIIRWWNAGQTNHKGFQVQANGDWKEVNTGALLSNAGTWTNASDGRRKTGFKNVNADEVLAAVRKLRITRWHHRDDQQKREYIGPVAQQFKRLFGLGESTSISTVDSDGLLFASVQALADRLERAEARLVAAGV